MLPNAESPNSGSQSHPITDGGRTADWTDVQLIEPGDGTWEIDLHLERSAVRTVVLRVRPSGLTGVVNSLLSDLDDEQVRAVLARVAERQGVGSISLSEE